MSQTRRFAAILAADVAGYSRLMGADEEATGEGGTVRLHPEEQRSRPSVERRDSASLLTACQLLA